MMSTGLHNEKLPTLLQKMSDEEEKHIDYELIDIESDHETENFCFALLMMKMMTRRSYYNPIPNQNK
jgi:hypothetical protein